MPSACFGGPEGQTGVFLLPQIVMLKRLLHQINPRKEMRPNIFGLLRLMDIFVPLGRLARPLGKSGLLAILYQIHSTGESNQINYSLGTCVILPLLVMIRLH